MRLTYCMFENIRNHALTEFEPAEGINVFVGNNGQGKTATLEAIALCTLSKSFTPSSDVSLRRAGEEAYSSSVNALSDLGILYKAAVRHKAGDRKRFATSMGKNLSGQDIVGVIPTVALSPDFKVITAGSPQDRRKFIDGILSQEKKLYLEELLFYRAALKRRNALLADIRNGERVQPELLDALTDVLIEKGGYLLSQRLGFIASFSPLVEEIYANVAGAADSVAAQYAPRYPLEEFTGTLTPSREECSNVLRRQFDSFARQERQRGVTVVGPHKDDLLFVVNGGEAREFASQGQHKSLLIALKLAEFAFLREATKETPLILFDDIFSELDSTRADKVLSLVESDVQMFITTTSLDNLNHRQRLRATIFPVGKGCIAPSYHLHAA